MAGRRGMRSRPTDDLGRMQGRGTRHRTINADMGGDKRRGGTGGCLLAAEFRTLGLSRVQKANTNDGDRVAARRLWRSTASTRRNWTLRQFAISPSSIGIPPSAPALLGLLEESISVCCCFPGGDLESQAELPYPRPATVFNSFLGLYPVHLNLSGNGLNRVDSFRLPQALRGIHVRLRAIQFASYGSRGVPGECSIRTSSPRCSIR